MRRPVRIILIVAALLLPVLVSGCGTLPQTAERESWLETLQQAAEQGDATAQNYLGVAYAKGSGVPQDDREAAKWYRRAADQGLAIAQANLGVRYAVGSGVPQDDREAAKWYRRAAEQGLASAQYLLGSMYALGRGVIQDQREAYIWFSLVAANGDKDAAKSRDLMADSLSSDERRSAQAEAKQRLNRIDARRAGKADEEEKYAPVPLTPVAPSDLPQSAAQRAFEYAWRSVVMIKTSDGQQGSGVIIRPNMVATNCHVVKSHGEFIVYKAEKRRARLDAPYPARLRLGQADKERDLCFLDVEELWGVPAQIREAKTLAIGEAVYAIGAPRGLDLSLSAGVVSQLRPDAAGGAPVIQTDATVSPGSSGGGLFDASGDLVGITTQKISDGEITFAIPAEWIVEMR